MSGEAKQGSFCHALVLAGLLLAGGFAAAHAQDGPAPGSGGVITPPALNEPIPQQPPPPPQTDKGTAVAAPPGIPTASNGVPFSFADLAERLEDAVVNISTSQKVTVSSGDQPDITVPPKSDPAPPKSDKSENSEKSAPFDDFLNEFFDHKPDSNADNEPRRVQSLGSGFVIDASGLIVTNNHVIADADEITANFRDGSKLTAELVGHDEKTDLALLRVKPKHPLKSVSFGDSDKLRVGEWVMAIGNPFGFAGSVTVGIVSALDRDINSGPYDRYIQTDASINRGNSGGPLFNLAGDVIGINTAIMSPTGGSIGIGFSIPAEIAAPVVDQLRQFGETRRGWIGVRIQEVNDEIAEGFGMDKAMGALIAGVTPDGPAAKAGLQAGDVVVEFNGKPVAAMRQLPQFVASTSPDKAVDLVVLRNGERKTLKITIGVLNEAAGGATMASAPGKLDEPDTPDQAEPGPAAAFGLTLAPITDADRKKFDIGAEVKGVLVTAVQAGSPAEEKRLQPGEVIVEIGQKPVASPEDVTKRLAELKADGRRSALFLVSGAKNELRFVSLRFEAG